ncbi:MAG: lysine--tRNA ligase [Candidatus Neomarinimicrobiota bacterium]|nr:MAG: lysine--tRNA ligase [Candidatus Neomarinimicrobiota bacterium]
MSETHTSLQQSMNVRREKLRKLRELGVNPYPVAFSRDTQAADIKSNYEALEGQSVTVAGRIMSLRRMGKASFCHLQDESGRIQCYLRRDDVGETGYEQFKLMDLGDFLGVTGYVFTTKTGEISIHASEITVLSKGIRPLPVVKEKDGEVFDPFEDKELRYRNRHLDLILNPEVREVFRTRARIISFLRHYLDEHGFLEVETPVLQPLYGGANARPFVTHHNALDQDFYLRIADELYLKRLIIGGFEKVYELSKNFRNEGIDRNHNPEFTALEFYQAYVDYEYMMDFVQDMIQRLARSLDKTRVNWGGMVIDLDRPFRRLAIFDALEEALGVDVRQFDESRLRDLARDRGLDTGKAVTYGQLLDELMKRLVEPGLVQPTFILDHPKAISPLAKPHRSGNPELVERFELFIGGAEFVNAFSELNDPLDQRERFEAQAALRRDGDEEDHPVDENFLEAVECGMPPTGGVGVGVDRLVMLFTENRWIKDVILFPTLRSQ